MKSWRKRTKIETEVSAGAATAATKDCREEVVIDLLECRHSHRWLGKFQSDLVLASFPGRGVFASTTRKMNVVSIMQLFILKYKEF